MNFVTFIFGINGRFRHFNLQMECSTFKVAFGGGVSIEGKGYNNLSLRTKWAQITGNYKAKGRFQK